MRTLLCSLLLLPLVAFPLHAAGIAIIVEGKPQTAIFVPQRLMDDAVKNPEPDRIAGTLKTEDNRRRLRESVKDFAAILERTTGAKIPIVVGKPTADEKRLPILVGELAAETFGMVEKKYPNQQGFRITVKPTEIGVSGESDLAVSYGLYTLLEQIGCRWYIPSPMGEVLPSTKSITFGEQDLQTGPSTIYRGIWFCDNDYARRNRMGGMLLSAGHNLELAIPKEFRKQHPEIRAIIGGKPHDHFVKWTHPKVADALVDACFAAVKADSTLKTYSLSPDDGITWDESDDKKLDANDFDPSTQTISKTDRLMVLTNRVAERVAAKHPEMRFGMLAYADYTRPPVREKVHPNIVPQIAPITFSRAHPMTDPGEPNNKVLRDLVEGWGKLSSATSYYFYGFYLAEVSAPNPMITKWGTDIPYIYKHGKCMYWQPETLSNFETCMHAHYLGLRMAWDNSQSPKTIIDELHAKFYGAAGSEMAKYWHAIDHAWVNTPEYAGCGFGHMRRWTSEVLVAAKKSLTAASAACKTDRERERVQLAASSFEQFERFMKLRRDLATGEWAKLATDSETYEKELIRLGTQYQPQFAFSRMGWTGERTLNVRYFDAFYKATYVDAARIAKDFDILTRPPLRQWKYQQDKEKKGEAAGWGKSEFDDSTWKTTDVMVDTWSALGFHNYMGSMWYRTSVNLPEAAKAKKTYLWIGATDGRVKVFINGTHIPYVDGKKKDSESFTGYCQPASFDITQAIRKGENRISLYCTRLELNELGTGGLIAAPVIYRDKQ